MIKTVPLVYVPKNLLYIGMKVFWTEPDYRIHGTIVKFEYFATDPSSISIKWDWTYHSQIYTYSGICTNVFCRLYIGVIVGKCKKLQKIWEENENKI